MLKAILRFFRPQFSRPAQSKVPALALTPQDIERNKHKHHILQTRIDAFREKIEADRLETMESGARRRVNCFISQAEEAVDKAFYTAGMC